MERQRRRPPLSAGRHTAVLPPRSRPCDACRSRKTRCVKSPSGEHAKCVLCNFHDRECTYLREPPARPRRHQIASPSSPKAKRAAAPPETSTTSEISGPGPESVWSQGSDPHHADTSLSLLDGTLSLDLDTHPEYVGATSHEEPALLDLQRLDDNPDSGSSPVLRPDRLARRVHDRAMFIIRSDDVTASEEQRVADCDAIEESVSPLGKTLVDLYFDVVHHSFPILHKAVFVSKHAVSHRLFSPPLLAAVYLIALDYQLYDRSIARGAAALTRPDGQAALEALAERTMADDLKRPKLSTLQAGLLLLQRCRTRAEAPNWLFTAQMVAVAQVLGLHADCHDWSIPEWEKGLRRRLGWAVYMQDKWGAFVHGRPPLLNHEDWDLRPCSLADFVESAADEDNLAGEDDSEEDAWQELFIRQTQLAEILAQVMQRYYSTVAMKPGGSLDQMGVVAAVEMAKPLMLQLREFATNLPEHLRLESTRLRRLSPNGSLHLACIATEVAVHRALVRLLTPSTAKDIVSAVRRAAKNRVQSATSMLESLRPEHTEAFWGGASAQQVAQIGSLAALLWVTADSPDEMRWCEKQIDGLRWVLRLRNQASSFIREALRLLERDITSLGLDSSR
ncbi:fungal-specific transcription factor domain-containing protein [Hypomontagnella monticulosa]|nr:fungal-specific transcription factor domain-containing protein [Hypomontagnella monticulosa]